MSASTAEPADAQTGGWSFISIPDLFNADYADLSGGADPEIAAVFGRQYANDLVAAPNWTPNSPNSMNPEFAAVLHQMMDDIAASTNNDPELALIAGDLVGGRWAHNRSELQRLFGTNNSTVEQELQSAADSYYSWIRTLFAESGIDTVVAAIGDHDIGDNPWRTRTRAAAVDPMKTNFGRNMVNPIFSNLSNQDAAANNPWSNVRFGPAAGNYDEGSFVYQQNNVLFVTVDVFRYEGGATLGSDGAVSAEVTGDHLEWVRNVLERAESEPSVDHVIVQGHTPILGPVATNRSSGLLLEDGEDSELWQTLAQFGTNVGGKVRSYFAGEVHATTTIVDPSSGIVQISHGALVQAINENFDNSDPTFLGIEVSNNGRTIAMTEYMIDLDRRGDTSVVWEVDRPISTSHDTYVSGPSQVGSLTIDVTNGTLDLSASGSLGVARQVDSGIRDLIAQSGEVTVRQRAEANWFTVTFDRPMTDPIVAMGPVSFNGVDPAHARVRNVTPTGFQYQVEEWLYLGNRRHTTTETISWLAVERGAHVTADGATIRAGSHLITDATRRITNINGLFDSPPVIVGQVASEAGSDPVTYRLSSITASRFDVALQEEEAQGPHRNAEDFNWIAFETGTFDMFATGEFGANHNGATTTLPNGYDGVTLASMQTTNGIDTAQLRTLTDTPSSLRVFVEEEQSADQETRHTFLETVGWVRTNQLIFG